MGYSTRVEHEPEREAWVVVLETQLTRAESNDVFLSGDSMISWPVDGLQLTEESGLQRSGMFVSEVAARPHGLVIRYLERAQADRAAAIIRKQLDRIGIAEEK